MGRRQPCYNGRGTCWRNNTPSAPLFQGVRATSAYTTGDSTFIVKFNECVSVNAVTGVQYRINGGAWTNVTSHIKNLLTADPFDVNAHTAQNGLTLTPGNKSLLTFPASAGAHLQLTHPTLGAGTSRLGWAAWTDSGTKDFRIDIYDAAAGHVAVDRTATTTRQWFSADLTLTGTNNLARVQNDVAGTAGTMHVENLYLSEAIGSSTEPMADGKNHEFSIAPATIVFGDVVEWQNVGGNNSIVDCANGDDIGPHKLVVDNRVSRVAAMITTETGDFVLTENGDNVITEV